MGTVKTEDIFASLSDSEQSNVAGLLAILDEHKGFRSKMFVIKVLADDILSNSYEASVPGGYKKVVEHLQSIVKGNKK